MSTPPPAGQAPGGPAGPARVPVAFLGRTSTLALQNPRASLRRQVRVRGEAPARVLPGLLPGVGVPPFLDVQPAGLDVPEVRGQVEPGRELLLGDADLAAQRRPRVLEGQGRRAA